MSRITAIIVFGLLLYEPPPTTTGADALLRPRHPPSQVVHYARFEPVYCTYYVDRCELYIPGWIAVSEPVPCD